MARCGAVFFVQQGEGTMRRAVRCAVALVVLAGVSGCAQWQSTHTERSAVEMQLLSTAVDRAVGKLDMKSLEGRKVFLDSERFEAVDQGYALGELEAAIREVGAGTVEREQAGAVLDVRSAVLANDHAESILGIPSLPVSIPGLGGFETPQLALWGRISQTGEAKFGLTGSDGATGMFMATRGHGRAYFNRYTLLIFIKWNTSDIPERRTGAFWGLFPSVAR
jgi:hypothetical protein